MHAQKLYCILNAAEGQLDIILCTEDTILCAQSWHAPTRGAEILTPALEALLKICKLSVQDITHFACIHGPGSFTGIRLVMGTIAAIRRVTGAANASIDYMQALALTAQHKAFALLPSPYTAHICVMTHARRNLVHGQQFTVTVDAKVNDTACPCPSAIAPALLYAPDALCMQMSEKISPSVQDETAHAYVIGSGLLRNKEAIFASLASHNISVGNAPHPQVSLFMQQHPTPQALWELAKTATYHHEDLEPLYIRPCDAVENLDHIATKQGMDAAVAHAKLASILAKPVCSSSE